MMQTKWKSVLDPFLENPLNSVTFINDVKLKIGVNVVNHLLQKIQHGWIVTDIQGPATVYRSAPFNDQTLVLTSSAAVTVSLGVY
jgi:hypothetical protein